MSGIKEWLNSNAVTIFINVVVVVWLAANIETRLAHAEKQLDDYGSFTQRIAVLETEIKNTNKLLEQVLVQLRK
jgi:hypothetical protein